MSLQDGRHIGGETLVRDRRGRGRRLARPGAHGDDKMEEKS
jgi:hypothetical protein